MKVEELMVGDLVKDKGVATRIDSLDFIENKNLSPIDLTEENLLKSGFVKTGRTDEVSFRYSKATDDYYSRVEIRLRKDEWVVHAEKFNIGDNSKYYYKEFVGGIKYAHELQHILRLTGIEKEVKI